MRKIIRRGLVLALLLLCLPLAALALDSVQPAGLAMYGGLTRDVAEEKVYSQAEASAPLGILKRGETCEILGQSGRYYLVNYQGQLGYVLKSKMYVKGQEIQEALPVSSLSDVTMDEYVLTISQAKEMPLKGTLRWDEPMDTLFYYIWDERQQQVEAAVVVTLSEPVQEIKASAFHNRIKLTSLSAGRKTVVIQGVNGDYRAVLFSTPIYVLGNCKEVRHVTEECTFNYSGKEKKALPTTWEATYKDTVLTVHLPGSGAATLTTLEWKAPPESALIEQLDENGQVIQSDTLSTGFYADAVEILPAARHLRITPTPGTVLRQLRVYDGRYPENAVQRWQTLPEKVDLMVFSAHQDDELLFLGGTIPYACAQGKTVAMVYMTNGGRNRYGEALEGMWTAGLRYHPIFLHWRDQKVQSLKTALNTWSMNGVDPAAELAALIRKYRPEVIVTQDWEGEYGHIQHKLTARLVAQAVTDAADPAFDPDSAAALGAWQVKKLYLHLYGENRISMDWDQPLDETGAVTPMFLAREAYDKHRSQQQAYSMTREAKRYDNSLFGLYFTAVGPDEAKNDFFEHIDALSQPE